jgi:beta-lactamase regulating signal transducer with metallopeptidase domain
MIFLGAFFSFSDMFLNVMLDATSKTTFILLIAIVATRFLRKSSSAVRHGILSLALTSALILPFLSQSLPSLSFEALPTWLMFTVEHAEPATITSRAAMNLESGLDFNTESPAANDVGGTDVAVGQSVISSRSHDGYLAISHPFEWLGSLVFAVWLSGAALVISGIMIAALRTMRLRAACSTEFDPEWRAMQTNVREDLGIRRHILLLRHPKISVPITCGTLRPVVVLPELFNGTSLERRRVLIHELAHIKRFDVAIQAFGQLSCALYFLHPLAWWCLRRLEMEREFSCDDCVLRSGERATDYAEQLTTMARQFLNSRRATFTVAMTRKTNLEKRIESLLNDDCRRAPMTWLSGLLLLSLSAMITLSLGVLHSTPVVAAMPQLDANPRSDAAIKAVTSDNGKQPDKATAPELAGTNTFPISVSGQALDSNGKPIVGASIFISDQRVKGKRIGETKTDASGRYSLRDVPLPIERVDTNNGRDFGEFIVFGKANGFGFAWRPLKLFHPNPKPSGLSYYDDPRDDKPTRYERDDRIELDLRFSSATTIRGKVVDSNGKPIPNTELSIWDCERVPSDGYGLPETETKRRFLVMDNNGFELLNADVPADIQIRHTDDTGKFEFANLPIGCRLRIRVNPPGFPARMIWVATETGWGKEHDGMPLYDGSTGLNLIFGIPVTFSVRAIYGDTRKPAPGVFVGASNSSGDSYKTTDDHGRVTLAIPAGEYRLYSLPAYKTPYLRTEHRITLGGTAPQEDFVLELRPAAQVEVEVIDAQTGKGIGNVDLWRESDKGYRESYFSTGWESKTRTVHRDRQRTDKNGVIHEVFEPGKHRIGVGHESYPEGYSRVEEDGIEIVFEAGETRKVTFHLRQKR